MGLLRLVSLAMTPLARNLPARIAAHRQAN
jgi:hypothetical protein